MDAFQSRFTKLFAQRIDELIQTANARAVHPMATDYADYCLRVGVIKGMRDAAKVAIDLESEMSREERADTAAVPSKINRYET